MRVFTRQALEGLAYLHQQDIIHCDIKCDNLLISPAHGVELIKLADFGVAIRVGTNNQGGSPHWMSPEAFTEKPSKPRDIWAVGCTVAEMLTGEMPWPSLKGKTCALYRISRSRSRPPLKPGFILTPEAFSFYNACTQLDAALRPTAEQLLCHAIFRRPCACEALCSVSVQPSPPAQGAA
jgi:serine/threonine protein kinase